MSATRTLSDTCCPSTYISSQHHAMAMRRDVHAGHSVDERVPAERERSPRTSHEAKTEWRVALIAGLDRTTLLFLALRHRSTFIEFCRAMKLEFDQQPRVAVPQGCSGVELTIDGEHWVAVFGARGWFRTLVWA